MSTPAAQVLSAQLPAIERELPAGPPLLRDYLAGAPALAPFFAGHPSNPAAYRRKAAEVDGRLDAAKRRRMADALRPLGPGAAARLERVLGGDGYFVTTGQQAGLFTGPLYTILKALSAMRLARTLEDLLGKPVVALFWSAGDDHDWAEVSSTAVLDAGNYVQRIALPADSPDTPPLAMSHRVLGPEAQRAVDELAALLPATEFRARYLEPLRAAYAPGASMAGAYEDALADIFAGEDLVLVSAADPLVKQHARPVLRRALEEASADERAVAMQSDRLVALGYHAQVAVAAGASNVFRQDEQGRERLVAEGGGWLLRRTRRRLAAAAVLQELEERPERYSPNVLLRPVVESALFPTLAYVGGPAETSYFAQIGCLFERHAIAPPLVQPRASLTLLEGKVRKVLDKFGLEAAAVRRPFEEVAAQLVREQVPAGVSEALARLRHAIREGYDGLMQQVQGIDPTLSGPLTGARNQALAQSGEMERKILQHLRQQNETHLEQLRRAAANLYPDGVQQERVLNVYPYLVRYGPDLLQALLARIEGPLVGGAVAGWDGVQCGPPPLPARLRQE